MGQTPEEWQHDLFDCFEGPDNLCMSSVILLVWKWWLTFLGLKATFCSCFVYGKTANRFENPSLQGYSHLNSSVYYAFLCIVPWNNTSVVYGLGMSSILLRSWIYVRSSAFPYRYVDILWWAIYSPQCLKQGKIRKAYGIQGGCFTDCLEASCCQCCALIRVEKEVITRQQLLQAGYVPPASMVASPMAS